MKFTPEIKKQIAEATGLTYLADNLEKLDATTEGQKVADMLRYYCPTAENLAIVNEQTLPAVKESNPEFTYDEDKPVVPVEKVTLTIVPTPVDATVKIGNAIGTSAEVEKLVPVTYEVSKAGYKTVSDTVTLTENKTIEVILEAEIEPVEKVTLTIVAEPADATVKINDVEQTSIEVDKGTSVKIEVSKEGYKTQLNEAYKVNKTETLTVELVAEEPEKPAKETVVSNVTLQITDEQSFIQAAATGGTAILSNDVELTKPIVVAKALTLNLNGKKVFNTQDIFKNDGTRSWSLISVRNAALTITGDGTLHAKENDCYALDVQENGSLTIEQGTYIGNIHAVYVFAGHADVQGGSFSVQQQSENPEQGYEFVLNCYNANREAGIASISVTGGKFVKFNPADCYAEGEHINFVSDGYQSTKVSVDPVTYEVTKVNIETAAAQPAKIRRNKK